MPKEHDNRIAICALLDAGKGPTEIARQLGVNSKTVYNVNKCQNLERKAGSGGKPVLDAEAVKDAVKADPLKSWHSHAKDMGATEATFRRTAKKVGAKSLVRTEKPLMTDRTKAKHLHHCQILLNDVKHRPAGHVLIFSDEKMRTVDPVCNCKNDCYTSSDGEIDESVRTLTTTKHPASVLSLGFVASNGEKCPLIWFPAGYRLTANDYMDILRERFLPWVRQTFLADIPILLQQEQDEWPTFPSGTSPNGCRIAPT